MVAHKDIKSGKNFLDELFSVANTNACYSMEPTTLNQLNDGYTVQWSQ